MRTLSTLTALTGLALCGAATSAPADTLRVNYGISLAGLPLGRRISPPRSRGRNTPCRWAQSSPGSPGCSQAARAPRRRRGGCGRTALAVFLRGHLAFANDQRTVRMGSSGGSVAALEIAPPLDEKRTGCPSRRRTSSVLDPVSASRCRLPPRATSPTSANCNRTLPIFDGAARFDVVLSYGETRQVEKPGYKGPVLVCNARYVPIAGHRALRPTTKFMQDNRDMSVRLAPVEGARLLVPLRIAVRTMVGMSVIEASRWAVNGDAVIPTGGREGERRALTLTAECPCVAPGLGIRCAGDRPSLNRSCRPPGLSRSRLRRGKYDQLRRQQSFLCGSRVGVPHEARQGQRLTSEAGPRGRRGDADSLCADLIERRRPGPDRGDRGSQLVGARPDRAGEAESGRTDPRRRR